MKSKLFIPLLLAYILSCFSACLKKGEDDPSISLRTRKARVVGKWKIKSGTNELAGELYDAVTGQPINKLSTAYSEHAYEQKVEGSNSTDIISGSLLYEIEFKKDGGYISTVTYDNISTTILKGNWNFTDKVGEHKNKDQIVINYTSQSYNSARRNFVYNTIISLGGNKSDETYYIKELRNKKIVLVSEYSSLSHSGVPYKNNSTLTFIQ